MSYYAGIDIGSTAIKIALADGAGRLAAASVTPTGSHFHRNALEGFQRLLAEHGISSKAVACTIATGYAHAAALLARAAGGLRPARRLIPPPRIHRHRYHGVLAPNAPLRAAVTAMAAKPLDEQTTATQATAAPGESTQSEAPRGEEAAKRAASRYLWAMLLARIYEVFPLLCPNCGAEMRLIAFISDSAPVVRILESIGEPSRPPQVAPARAPPWWAEEAAHAEDDLAVQPPPDYVFDQTVNW